MRTWAIAAAAPGSATLLLPGPALRVVPNPFPRSTRLRFELTEAQEVSLRIYDGAGRLVRRLLSGERRPAGAYEVLWSAEDDRGRRVPAEVYSCALRAGDQWRLRKLVLLD